MMHTPEKPTSRLVRQPGHALAALAVCALTLSALPAGAQGVSGSSAGGAGTASGAAGVTSSGTPRGAGNSASDTGAMVSRDDSKIMTDLAHANIAEIETGKLALEKSQNEQVRKFAQHMIDEHTSALKELQTLAQAKGVTLPDGTDLKHKTMATALKVMSGNSFDTQYMKRAGVGDHQQTIELLQKTQKNAKDPELKATATKMLPTVREHLKMAQEGVVAVSAKK
jgi:putative membrane protein